ncbi:Hypothetical predicted protein [Mytilus galloprovincialis]|uniref:Uncharacterized protein n=1 Tax=Mytilus galloprovincialis TaxID=29158 RepID=A0A8B6FQC2_MYTGA|nr:Hypothetical predicted protein [Mytilus galloprovincialis]
MIRGKKKATRQAIVEGVASPFISKDARAGLRQGKGSECLCITDQRFSEEITNSYTTVNIDACNITCIGNHGDICGGDSSTYGKVLYSVYKIINRTESDGMQFGSTCSAIQFDESMKKVKANTQNAVQL